MGYFEKKRIIQQSDSGYSKTKARDQTENGRY